MNTKQFLQSHTLAIMLSAFGVVILIMGAFSLGEHIGYRKAAFAFQNGNNFYDTFGPRPRMSRMMPPVDFSDTHGTVGKVISIALPTITIEDRDGTEKTIVISDQTVIKKFRDTITSQSIAVGDYLVAIGEPNQQSQIAATLIRLLPPLPVQPQ